MPARTTQEKNIRFTIPVELHAMIVRAAKLDRRSLANFFTQAAEERANQVLENDPNSPQYIPVGLRKPGR